MQNRQLIFVVFAKRTEDAIVEMHPVENLTFLYIFVINIKASSPQETSQNSEDNIRYSVI